ncbi:MAG: hypothetical protein ACOH5I_24815 [Oligoflexus sp.]
MKNIMLATFLVVFLSPDMTQGESKAKKVYFSDLFGIFHNSGCLGVRNRNLKPGTKVVVVRGSYFQKAYETEILEPVDDSSDCFTMFKKALLNELSIYKAKPIVDLSDYGVHPALIADIENTSLNSISGQIHFDLDEDNQNEYISDCLLGSGEGIHFSFREEDNQSVSINYYWYLGYDVAGCDRMPESRASKAAFVISWQLDKSKETNRTSMIMTVDNNSKNHYINEVHLFHDCKKSFIHSVAVEVPVKYEMNYHIRDSRHKFLGTLPPKWNVEVGVSEPEGESFFFFRTPKNKDGNLILPNSKSTFSLEFFTEPKAKEWSLPPVCIYLNDGYLHVMPKTK